MTVKEYREKNRKCVYCIHYIDFDYCHAKEKVLFFNKAKRCKLYQAKEYLKNAR